MKTLGFIGTGNMGSALAKAASLAEGNRLLLVNRHPEKAERLSCEIGGSVASQADAAAESDFLFLGVKPVMLPALAETLSPQLAARQTRFVLVSMLAGVTIEKLQAQLQKPHPVIRIMPNTPVSVGEGMVLYCCSKEVTPEEESAFLTAMHDAGMAVSGCGPAYVDLFIEALADAGVACGLPRKDAVTLAAQMTLGSARLVLESGKHPGELKDAVCSPGGTTIQGVRMLEARNFRSAVIEAVIAACKA